MGVDSEEDGMEIYIVTALDHKTLEHEVIAAAQGSARADRIAGIAADDLCNEANEGKNPAFPPMAVIQEHDSGFFILQGEKTLHEICITREKLL